MEYLADTVALVRHLRSGRVGERAAEILLQADSGEHTIFISAISLMEVLYLAEGNRIELHLQDLVNLISDRPNYILVPVGIETMLSDEQVDDVPELHDRIIVATAKFLRVPLLTNDHMISRSKHVTAIW